MLLPRFTENTGPVRSAILSVPSATSSFTTTTISETHPRTLSRARAIRSASGPEIMQTDMGRGADMALVYRNEAGGQPWANRLAEESILVYVLKLRDRCRSGLSGSPGKRVLGKTNRGFESLPVRTLVRRESSIRRRRYLDGSQGNGGPIPPCPTLLRPAVAGLRRAGRTGIFSHAKVAKGMLFINL